LKTLDKYIPLSELRKYDSKSEVYLSSDIEPFYTARNLFKIQTNNDTYISVKKDNKFIAPEEKTKKIDVEKKMLQNRSHKPTRFKYYQFTWMKDDVEEGLNILSFNKKNAVNLFETETNFEVKNYNCICIEEKFTRKYRFQNGIDFFLRGYPLIKEDDEYYDKRLLYKK
jgi:hypothetical protein